MSNSVTPKTHNHNFISHIKNPFCEKQTRLQLAVTILFHFIIFPLGIYRLGQIVHSHCCKRSQIPAARQPDQMELTEHAKGSVLLSTNNLNNRELDKEAPQNVDLERVIIVRGQGTSEDQNFEGQPTRSKTDSSAFFGITIDQRQNARENQKYQPAKPTSLIAATLPNDALQNINFFLSYKDQGQFAQVAVFARHVVRESQNYYRDLMTPLKRELDILPKGPLNIQRLVVGLVASPAAGHPKYWIPVMDALMKYLSSKEIDEHIQTHTIIAGLLATSSQPISTNQIYQFCKYLGKRQLSEKVRPWIGYRALEQYLLNPQLNFASVTINGALKEYLTEAATVFMKAAYSSAYSLPNHRKLRFQQTVIDPRFWFGLTRNNSSLFAQNNGIAPTMPDLLVEVLFTHIQSLRESEDIPFTVSMVGRMEAELPDDFTLPLALRLTNANIFLDHNHTINIENIENPDYARPLSILSNEEMEELYPNAIV